MSAHAPSPKLNSRTTGAQSVMSVPSAAHSLSPEGKVTSGSLFLQMQRELPYMLSGRCYGNLLWFEQKMSPRDSCF